VSFSAYFYLIIEIRVASFLRSLPVLSIRQAGQESSSNTGSQPEFTLDSNRGLGWRTARL